jgi:hypothetical protein
MPQGEEAFLPFGETGSAPVTAVRSTVILTSLRAFRSRGVYDRYFAALHADYRERILSVTSGVWLPMEIARVHYVACDSLGLDRAMIEDIGAESGRVLNHTVLSVLAKLSREAGASPWTALKHTNRLVGRTWQGSTCGVFKLGPKEARLEWLGQTLASIPYFRTAFGGFIAGALQLFGRAAVVREIPRYCTTTTLGYRCSWV